MWSERKSGAGVKSTWVERRSVSWAMSSAHTRALFHQSSAWCGGMSVNRQRVLDDEDDDVGRSIDFVDIDETFASHATDRRRPTAQTMHHSFSNCLELFSDDNVTVRSSSRSAVRRRSHWVTKSPPPSGDRALTVDSVHLSVRLSVANTDAQLAFGTGCRCWSWRISFLLIVSTHGANTSFGCRRFAGTKWHIWDACTVAVLNRDSKPEI